MKLAKLYKRTAKGATQFWEIETTGNTIKTTYGQVGGKEQVTEDVVKRGKNAGKANATTPEQQAEAEASAKWEKQIKKNYVENLDRAEAGETDVEGGVEPMLAHKFSEHCDKVTFPCYCQPKFDGSRVLAIIKGGSCTLWSRTKKQISSLPHIVSALESQFSGKTITLDGEAYNHKFKNDFETIMKLVRPKAPVPGHELVQYHIYDIVDEKLIQSERTERLGQLLPKTVGPLVPVPTVEILNEEELAFEFERALVFGHEGVMVRNANAYYECKRSYNLQKVKEFLDDEFDIIGIKEGRGRLQGHVGAFVCLTKDGKEFEVKMRGQVPNLRHYFLDHSLWTNNKLVVQYQNLTKDGIPRFPVGIRFRTSPDF